jgi:hypothetical protein
MMLRLMDLAAIDRRVLTEGVPNRFRRHLRAIAAEEPILPCARRPPAAAASLIVPSASIRAARQNHSKFSSDSREGPRLRW